MEALIPIIIIGVAVLIFLTLLFSFVPVGLWITAYFSGVKIGLFTLVGMRLRKVIPSRIVRPMIKATKGGIHIDVDKLEAHYLAGGNVNTVVDAL
ncbi:flotillin-like FloA family protein, partial [Senegalia sp. (in: firmicutes)]